MRDPLPTRVPPVAAVAFTVCMFVVAAAGFAVRAAYDAIDRATTTIGGTA